jgi:hypothetical protein
VVAAFADRDLSESTSPYEFLDATYCEAWVCGTRNGQGSRVVSQVIVVATGVSSDGRREVLSFAVGEAEEGAWTQIPEIAQVQRTGRDNAGDLRCPRRAEGRDRRGDGRLGLVTVSGAFPTQRPGQRPQGLGGDGRRRPIHAGPVRQPGKGSGRDPCRTDDRASAGTTRSPSPSSLP